MRTLFNPDQRLMPFLNQPWSPDGILIWLNWQIFASPTPSSEIDRFKLLLTRREKKSPVVFWKKKKNLSVASGVRMRIAVRQRFTVAEPQHLFYVSHQEAG